MTQFNTQNESLCIALVAPIGVDLNLIEKLLITEIIKLKIYSPFNSRLDQYEQYIIDISMLLKNNKHVDAYNSIIEKMNMGDKKRKKLGYDGALAVEIAPKIKKNKLQVIHQLKTPEEIDYLRSYLHQKNIPFFVISVFDTIENRTKKLQSKLQFSKIKNNNQIEKLKSANSLAQDLIDRDQKDMQNKFGQNVSEAFPLADFFIDASYESTISSQIDRIIKAIFCHPHISPTLEEYGMYLAEGCGLRSRDLSRQVGAAILDNKGSILSLGCNEAPKAFGGCYWENDTPDNRDFILNVDSNYDFRNKILNELFSILSSLNEFKKSNTSIKKIQKIGISKFISDNKSLFKNTRIMNLIEFGRSQHAEVGAIADAARKGISLESGILFTTVFPCHLCSRYIISSGIKKIVFIEPYPKSLTLDLYFREITFSIDSSSNTKILLKPFIGIAPRIYRKIFIYDKYLHNDKKNEDASAKSWTPNLKNWTHILPFKAE
jgi:deoxycytidylate deaminase